MYPTTGYTPELTETQKLENEIATVREFIAAHPENKYWQNRLVELTTKLESAEIAELLDSLTVSERAFVRWVTEPDGCGNDDLYDWARGG